MPRRAAAPTVRRMLRGRRIPAPAGLSDIWRTFLRARTDLITSTSRRMNMADVTVGGRPYPILERYPYWLTTARAVIHSSQIMRQRGTKSADVMVSVCHPTRFSCDAHVTFVIVEIEHGGRWYYE